MREDILGYIKETPRVIIENVKGSRNFTNKLVHEFTLEHYFKDVWIVASGSSYNAAIIAKDYIRETMEVEVKVVTPATFVNYEYQLVAENFVFVVSADGEGLLEIAALDKIRELNRKAICVTTNVDGQIKNHADILVDYSKGVKVEDYAKESVLILATFLMLFALETAFKLFIVDEEEMFVDRNHIKEAMFSFNKTALDTFDFIENNKEALASMKVLYLIALGSNLGSAYEAAFLISKNLHIPTIVTEPEDYLIGPHLQLSPEYSVIVFDNGDQTQARSLQIYEAVKRVTDNAFLISPSFKGDDKRILNVYNPQKRLFNPLSTLPAVVLIANYLKREIKPHPLMEEFNEIIKASED